MSSTEQVEITASDALIVVDVQRDFLPGGALPVATGRTIIEPLNETIRRFTAERRPVFASRDWHPADHCSFEAQGGRFPPHCVVGTPGADFAPELRLPPDVQVVSKGTRPDSDAFSCFNGTELAEQLKQQGIARVFMGGLTSEYCVRASVLDALQYGFTVLLLTDAMAAVVPAAGDAAINEMIERGARPITSERLT